MFKIKYDSGRAIEESIAFKLLSFYMRNNNIIYINEVFEQGFIELNVLSKEEERDVQFNRISSNYKD